MTVRERDRGAKALLKRLSDHAKVTVGVHADDGAAAHGDDGATVADIASFHEFGLGVPRRSFINDWADENEAENKAALRQIAEAVIVGKVPDLETGLQRFGLHAVGQVQKRIAGGIEPELAESTIARKGSSVPLIDTGVLRSSITHKVEK